jgi:hypothetical protein
MKTVRIVVESRSTAAVGLLVVRRIISRIPNPFPDSGPFRELNICQLPRTGHALGRGHFSDRIVGGGGATVHFWSLTVRMHESTLVVTSEGLDYSGRGSSSMTRTASLPWRIRSRRPVPFGRAAYKKQPAASAGVVVSDPPPKGPSKAWSEFTPSSKLWITCTQDKKDSAVENWANYESTAHTRRVALMGTGPCWSLTCTRVASLTTPKLSTEPALRKSVSAF